MPKSKKISLVFFIYWFLLLYIFAALVWWFIALSRQNEQMAALKIQDLKQDNQYTIRYNKIENEKGRKTAQYIGEGSIFLLLIVAGAIFVYKAVNRELKLSRQQQHFMIAVTHELKTPIAIAKLNLETLQLRKLDIAQQQRLIFNTLEETNRLNSLCNNMLISSQIEAGGYRITNEEINIVEIVNDCINDFETRFPNRIINSDISNELYVSGDLFLLQIAVNNLLDNAIKYSPRESTIEVAVLQNKANIEIRVRDEGSGIEPQDKKRVFEKFYRLGNEATKRAKGTGLGLYLTKKIIDAHHGHILIQDNHPAGSIFIIALKQVA